MASNNMNNNIIIIIVEKVQHNEGEFNWLGLF